MICDPNNKLIAGPGIEQVDANTVLVPFASITGNIQVNTLDGNDTLTLDLANGDSIPDGGLTYNGGLPTTGPGDKLVITGGSQGTVTYNYTNPHDGNINMSNFGTVTYTGLEPITNSGTAADVIFNLPASGTTNILLGDDGAGGNGMSRLSSSPVTFETTDFSNPTSSVQINRGTATDNITVAALPDLTSSLFVGAPAAPFNIMSFSGAVTLASGNSLMAYSSGGMGLTGAGVLATSGTGQISLTTASGLTLPAGSSINTVNGALTLNANQQPGPTTGNFYGVDMFNATVQATGTGVVTVNGKGGSGAGVNYGLYVRGGSTIKGGNTGASTNVTGTGGAGGSNGHGIDVENSTITSFGGNVQVTGLGGAATRTDSYGVIIINGATVTSGVNGNVTVDGTGGANNSNNHGVMVYDLPSKITAAGAGLVAVNGTGGAGTSNGVFVWQGGVITSAGGTVTVTSRPRLAQGSGWRRPLPTPL